MPAFVAVASGSPWARKGLVAILLRKIAARPCSLDCSGKPGFFCEAKKMRPNSSLNTPHLILHFSNS
jgi:hypothetical protein